MLKNIDTDITRCAGRQIPAVLCLRNAHISKFRGQDAVAMSITLNHASNPAACTRLKPTQMFSTEACRLEPESGERQFRAAEYTRLHLCVGVIEKSFRRDSSLRWKSIQYLWRQKRRPFMSLPGKQHLPAQIRQRVHDTGRALFRLLKANARTVIKLPEANWAAPILHKRETPSSGDI